MSTRKTRRGTLLDVNCKENKFSETHLKKQNLSSADNTFLLQKDGENESNNLMNGSSVCSNSTLDSNQIEPQISSTTNNIPTYRNVWIGNNMTEKEEAGHTNTSKNTVPTEKVLTEIVDLRNASSVHETPKKSRKPEILVSLLESEAYPCVKLKVKSEEKHDNGDENKIPVTQKSRCHSVVNKFKEKEPFLSAGSKPVCILPYCEHHSNETFKTNFLPISDIPEEPFLVSLSKDKHKELNMVTTSSGTLRVGPGCSMRRLLPSAQAFPTCSNACAKSAYTDKNYCANNLTDPELAIEVKKNMQYNLQLQEPSNEIMHTEGLRQSANHRNGDLYVKEFTDSNAHSLEICSLQTVGSKFFLSQGEVDNNAVWFPDFNCNNMALTKTSSAHRLKTTGCSIPDIDQMQESDCCKNSVTPTDASLSKSNKKEICPSMGESVLDGDSRVFFTQSAFNHISTKNIGDKIPKQCKEPVSLLKTSPCFTKTMPAAPCDTLSVCSNTDNQGAPKRSERIRSKSKLMEETFMNLDKSEIASANQLGKKSKSKLKCADWIVPKVKISFKKKCLKKAKGTNSNSKKSFSEVTSKTVSKPKKQMTRKVMDGIMQSIEETILRASQDDLNAENDKPGETKVTINSISNSEISLSGQVSYPEELSINSMTLQIRKKNADVQKSSTITPNLPDSQSCTTKKWHKLQKVKQKALKISKSSTKLSNKKAKKNDISKCKQSKSNLNKHCVSTISLNAKDEFTSRSANFTDTQETVLSKTSATIDFSSGLSIQASKRSRKKTKKAKEAVNETSVFWEDDQPVKRSKSKKRSVSETDSSGNNTKRSRRGSLIGELMADPVLEKHAFILWASENRSQVEMQYQTASACEVDAILSSRWYDVLGSVKGRFFLRAREALSDDDRHSLQTCSIGNIFELDPLLGHEQHLDRDPLFIEFMQLPVDKQREMLRKWLKFFQKMLPKKEYIDFIVNFKNACGESAASVSTPDKPIKRPRMWRLDPSHYRMLFDMIRLTRPRIVEICKEKKGKEKKLVSQTYSMIVQKLVSGEPWPEDTVNTCQSQSLTQILLDLNIEDSSEGLHWNAYCMTKSADFCLSEGSNTRSVKGDLLDEDIFPTAEEECAVSATTLITLGPAHCPWTENQFQDMQDIEFSGDFLCDSFLDERDYACLNSDLAQTLFTDLAQLQELPVIDQSTLDQVFLAPPCKEARCIQPRRGGGGGSNGNGGSMAGYAGTAASPCLAHPLLAVPSSSYPKMNIHHPPVIPRLNPYHSHQQNLFAKSVSTALSAPSPLSSTCRKDSLMDMHSYSINVDESNDSSCMRSHPNLGTSPVGPPNFPSKCIKACSKTMVGPSAKLSVQALHLPQAPPKAIAGFSCTRSGGPLTGASSRMQHPKIVPSGTEHQHLMSSHMLAGSPGPVMSSKSKAHHMLSNRFGNPVYPAKSLCSSASLVSSCSRFYSQHGSLGSNSPLITSLSPLRNVKYQGQVSSKLYTSPCSMMPYRPRLQLTDTPTQCHRKATHTIPINTTLSTFGTARAAGGNIQQIKVCLPTQALKIPIAKLRGAKKSTYIKGKLKNVGLPPSGADGMGSVSCIPQQSCKPSSSVLAKVLSFQVKSEAVCAGGEYRSPIITEMSYTSPKLSPTATTFIGTMRSMGSHFSYVKNDGSNYRSSKKVQLVSVDSRVSYSKSLGSTHTAVIVSPMSIHKRGSAGLQHQTLSSASVYTSRSTSAFAANMGSFAPAGFTSASDHLPSFHMNGSSFKSEPYKKNMVDANAKHLVTFVSTSEDRAVVTRACNIPTSEDDDKSCESQFVVVGTRTTCLPVPKKRADTVIQNKAQDVHRQENGAATSPGLTVTLASALSLHSAIENENQISSSTEIATPVSTVDAVSQLEPNKDTNGKTNHALDQAKDSFEVKDHGYLDRMQTNSGEENSKLQEKDHQNNLECTNSFFERVPKSPGDNSTGASDKTPENSLPTNDLKADFDTVVNKDRGNKTFKEFWTNSGIRGNHSTINIKSATAAAAGCELCEVGKGDVGNQQQQEQSSEKDSSTPADNGN